MKNIRILDCTLRDGGRIIDCAFNDQETRAIASRLNDAKIDIIEVGFLRDWRKVDYKGDSTFFTNVEQISPFINRTNKDTIFAAFIDFGMCDIDALKVCDGTSVDAIRFGFTKKNYLEEKEEVIRWAKIIKEKGYKLFVQGVNSLSYTDYEILQVIEMVNEIHPYSYGIVDTYGAMYIDDVDRLYGLINNNLLSDICINFHSHNNYQLSFAFAQEVIKLASVTDRKVIIDGTLSGMGKVAGNLCTELIVDFLVRKLHKDYDLDIIFDCIDDYIEKYAQNYKWGYSVPALMAGIYESHPNNIIYLTSKFRLTTKDIGKLLSMIEPSLRTMYDYDNIQRLYVRYSCQNVEDAEAISKLREVSKGRDVLVLVPGSSLNRYREQISEFIGRKKPVIVSVNFDSDLVDAWAFYGNKKRYEYNHRIESKAIITSNITPKGQDLVINYHKLINREHKYFDNTTVMLLNLIKKMNFENIYFAGFDGFSTEEADNFIDMRFQNERHSLDEFKEVNRDLSAVLCDFADAVSNRSRIVFITPSYYQRYIDRNDISFRVSVDEAK